MSFILQGLILGLSVAIPIGPMGLLIIQRTLQKGYKSGLATGFGVASADFLFAWIAGFGAAKLARWTEGSFENLGAIVVLILGLKMILEKPKEPKLQGMLKETAGYLGDYASAFVLIGFNPAGILFFLSVFTALGFLEKGESSIHIYNMVIGVFMGSLLWWCILVGITHRFQKKWKPEWKNRINKGIGLGLILISLGILIKG